MEISIEKSVEEIIEARSRNRIREKLCLEPQRIIRRGIGRERGISEGDRKGVIRKICV